MLRPNLITRKANVESDFKLTSSEEAKICTECPLPAKSCNKDRCKRFEEERRRLKAK